MTTWPEKLQQLVEGTDLSTADTAWVMNEVLGGEAPPVNVAAFMAALAAKGETTAELEGLVSSMLEHAVRIEVPGRTVDVVGTGGDNAHTVNISTMASVVVAATGLTVVKHGNKAATSKSGSADVMAALGVKLDLSPTRVVELAAEVGVTFCHAPVFHPAMRFVGPIRRQLGIPTIFNVLGPLSNPAQPAASAIGVSNARWAPLMAGVIARQGRDAILFRGDDGLDELAATSVATIWEVRAGTVSEVTLDPVADLGMTPISVGDLRGGEAEQNAQVARDVFAGATGPIRDTVVLNAAAGLVADGTLPGTGEGSVVDRLRAAMALCDTAIDDGLASGVLSRWAEASQR